MKLTHLFGFSILACLVSGNPPLEEELPLDSDDYYKLQVIVNHLLMNTNGDWIPKDSGLFASEASAYLKQQIYNELLHYSLLLIDLENEGGYEPVLFMLLRDQLSNQQLLNKNLYELLTGYTDDNPVEFLKEWITVLGHFRWNNAVVIVKLFDLGNYIRNKAPEKLQEYWDEFEGALRGHRAFVGEERTKFRAAVIYLTNNFKFWEHVVNNS